jgi:hypothetical protein
MAKQSIFHVVPHHGSWAVRKQSNGSINIFESKSDAIDDAKKRARKVNSGSIVVVHGKSGQIIQSTSTKSRISEKVLRDAVRKSHKPQRVATSTTKSTKASHARKG